jgi:acetyl esterase/lipase
MLPRLLLPLAVVAAVHAAGPPAAPAPAPAAATPAATPKKATPKPIPRVTPTEANVSYGTHPKQILDFWKANSATPTGLVFYIHGGGWTAGTKDSIDPTPFLQTGISVVSVEYRFIQEAQALGIKPPVDAPLKDAARALQFVRSKAKEWNIDPKRIGATGGSAGACSSLWLDFHPDLADPKSADPIAHESTRLYCAAVNGAQTSLDPKQLLEWTPNSRYGGHAFGYMTDVKGRDKQFAEFAAHRDELLPLIKEYSPYELVTSDDPPVYLIYTAAPGLGQEQKDPTHTSNYGVKLQEHCKALGVECELVYPGAPDVKHASIDAYLIKKLKK